MVGERVETDEQTVYADLLIVLKRLGVITLIDRRKVFSQQLELTRVQNDQIINASMITTPSGRDSVSTNNKNQQTSTSTNTTTAAGDGGTIDPAAAYGGSNNAREQTGT